MQKILQIKSCQSNNMLQKSFKHKTVEKVTFYPNTYQQTQVIKKKSRKFCNNNLIKCNSDKFINFNKLCSSQKHQKLYLKYKYIKNNPLYFHKIKYHHQNQIKQKINIFNKQQTFNLKSYQFSPQKIQKQINIHKNKDYNKIQLQQKYLKYNLLQTTSSLKSLCRIPHFLKDKHKNLNNPKKQNININRFIIIKKIGQGSFGSVFIVKQIYTNYLLAMKVIKKSLITSNNMINQFINEIKIQSYLDHPRIVKIFGFFADQVYFYLLMELCSDGSLYQFIQYKKGFTEQGCSIIAKSLLLTLQYIHSKKIIHRDFKTQNVVLILGEIKVCDFGWAVRMQNCLRSTFCGTPLFYSPQLLLGSNYDQKVDLWSFGILIYQLYVGINPFNVTSISQIQQIIENEVRYPVYSQATFEFKQFINFLLEKNPNKRLNSSQMLKTQFIRKYNGLQIIKEII